MTALWLSLGVAIVVLAGTLLTLLVSPPLGFAFYAALGAVMGVVDTVQVEPEMVAFDLALTVCTAWLAVVIRLAIRRVARLEQDLARLRAELASRLGVSVP